VLTVIAVTDSAAHGRRTVSRSWRCWGAARSWSQLWRHWEGAISLSVCLSVCFVKTWFYCDR